MQMCLNVSAVLQIWRAFVHVSVTSKVKMVFFATYTEFKSYIQAHFEDTAAQGLTRFELERVIHTT